MTVHERSGARWYSETVRSVVSATLLVAVGALLIGGLTSYGQQYLPTWVNSLSNSAGGWTMFAFLLIWLSRARMLLGAILGIVALELLNQGYGIVSAWRGVQYGAGFGNLWTVLGIIAGPLVGFAASLCRYGSPLWRSLAVTPLSAVLMGEGVYGLTTIADTTSPVYWTIEVVLSVAFVALALARARIRSSRALLVVVVWLVGSAAFFALIRFVL